MPRKAPKTPSKAAALSAQADARLREQGIETEPEEFSLDWYRADWPARKKTFIEREIKIRNAFNRNKLEPFILNDAQIELYEASLEASEDSTQENCTLKCRRIGGTTYYLADYFSDCVIESGHDVRVVAHDPDTLNKFIKVVNEMYKNLRTEIRPHAKYNSKYELEFDDPEKGVTGSRIGVSTVTPGQEEKGRGDTFTRLHLTEIPFWRGDADQAATALCDAAKGGKISYESTPKGVGDFFHKKYVMGKLGQGGVQSHCFAWWWNRNYQIKGARFVFGKQIASQFDWYLLKPGQHLAAMEADELERARVSDYTEEERNRQSLPIQSERNCAQAVLDYLKQKGYVGADADWFDQAVAQFILWRRNEIEKKGAKKFRVEYLENDVDCWAATGGGVFDPAYLVLKAEFRDAETGHEYMVHLDPSNGIEGGDPFYLGVIDCNTGDQVYGEAGIKKQDWQGQRCVELSNKYNAAEIGIEANMGEAAILEVERLGYGHRLYKHIDAQTERDIADNKISYREAWLKAKPGMPLTERLKRLIINEFERALRTGEFKCADQYMLEEAKVFVQNGEKLEAKSGYHDDSINCLSQCWYRVVHGRVGAPGFVSTGVKLGSAMAGAY